MSSEQAGKLVVLTGIDGSGKSTQTAALVDWLRAQGQPAEPAHWRMEEVEGTFIGDLVARLAKSGKAMPPRTTLLLAAANLAYRCEHTLLPALREGRIIVEDDVAYKMMARACAHGLERQWVEQVMAFLPEPAHVLVVDVPAQEALDRLGDKVTLYEAGLHAADRGAGFLEHQGRVREVLLDLARARGFAVVEAQGPDADAVQARLRASVADALGLEGTT